jgi:hypothetical protein
MIKVGVRRILKMTNTAHPIFTENTNLPPANKLDREQTSSERNFRVYENSLRLRFKRNIRIFIYLAKLYWRWLIFGGRIRKAWRQADKTGQPFVLEDVLRLGK